MKQNISEFFFFFPVLLTRMVWLSLTMNEYVSKLFLQFFWAVRKVKACCCWKEGIDVKRGNFVFLRGILSFFLFWKIFLVAFIKSFNSFCNKILKKKTCWVRIPVHLRVSCCIPLSLSTVLWMFGATQCTSVKRLGYFSLKKSCAILLQFP